MLFREVGKVAQPLCDIKWVSGDMYGGVWRKASSHSNSVIFTLPLSDVYISREWNPQAIAKQN